LGSGWRAIQAASAASFAFIRVEAQARCGSPKVGHARHSDACMLRMLPIREDALMLEIPLDPELERHLAEIAARVGEAPGELARKALLAYLEDLEDYAVAVEAWKEHDPGSTLSTEEVLRELGVED
jgi:predicted DNA-binding protein